jgi:ketosteroid isomerase-like protein
MTNSATVLAVAAVVYDQDTHSPADLAFLDAMAKADREWLDQLSAANINFGGGSEAWQAVKRLATRSRNGAYARALAVLEANDTEWLLEAAE